MKRSIACLVLLLSGSAFAEGSAVEAAAVGPTLANWGQAHPMAQTSLADWVQTYPEAARRVFFWDRDHPLRAQYFIRWMVEHPDQGLDDFTSAHADWPVIPLVLAPNRPAVEAFMQWGRSHRSAALDFAAEPRGLSWFAFNRMANLWDAHPLKADPSTPAGAIQPAN